LATISVPELDYHDVLVIGQGQHYDPPVTPMRVVFPFPSPTSLPVGNQVHLVAVPTQGTTQALAWSVDGIPGGSQRVGTVDASGNYSAPDAIPPGGSVVITATSQTDPAGSASLVLSITDPVAFPWTAPSSSGFRTLTATDLDHAIPSGWQIVDGRGDWDLTSSAGHLAIANTNVAEGERQGNTIGYPAMLVGGDQAWTEYAYSVTITPTAQPLVWYGDPQYTSDTSVGVVARFANAQNYYEYRLCADGMTRLYATLAGVLQQIGQAVPAAFPAPGNATTVAVRAQGSTLALFVNGQQVRQDQGITLLAGSVGLTASLTQNDFSSISVSPL
jgi:hypothetical protein